MPPPDICCTMVVMRLTKQQKQILKQYLWWGKSTGEFPLKKTITYLLHYGQYDDVKKLLHTFPESAVSDAIEKPLPGVWTPKSLNFWAVYFKKKPKKVRYFSL